MSLLNAFAERNIWLKLATLAVFQASRFPANIEAPGTVIPRVLVLDWNIPNIVVTLAVFHRERSPSNVFRL
jgi:hypothetical protein